MTDLLIIETGSGGDLVFDGNDLKTVSGLENQPYLAMFGDNGAGWWGNDLLLANGDNNQFISQTEQALNTYALNSAGRIKDEAAINADLQYLTNGITGTTVTVSSSIAAVNRLDVTIIINGQTFFLAWQPDKGFLNYQV